MSLIVIEKDLPKLNIEITGQSRNRHFKFRENHVAIIQNNGAIEYLNADKQVILKETRQGRHNADQDRA